LKVHFVEATSNCTQQLILLLYAKKSWNFVLFIPDSYLISVIMSYIYLMAELWWCIS
jgi:hypothetical protein